MATALVSAAAAVAAVGGLAWVVKGGAILAGFAQPPVLLELGLACFGVTLLLLAVGAGARVSTALGAIATGAGLVSLLTDAEGVDAAIAATALALLAGLLLLPPERQPGGRLPWGIGLATVPVLGVGGLLALADEALLEVPTVVLGLAWTGLGLRLGASLRKPAQPASA